MDGAKKGSDLLGWSLGMGVGWVFEWVVAVGW